MAASKTIKNALVTLLTGLELTGEPAFTEVKGHPRGEFDGFPSVRILPAEMPNEKAAYGQNDRTVSFLVRTHLPVKEVDGVQDGSEFDYMYDLTDLLLNSLDEADFDNTLQASIGTYILEATRADWYEGTAAAGPLLICDVAVNVKYSQDL